MSTVKISDSARLVWNKSIRAYRRILLLGPSGWFGRTALELMDGCQVSTLLIGSRARSIEVNDRKYDIRVWDLDTVRNFAPDLVLDFAFLTRNYISVLGEAEFMRQNSTLVSRLREAVSLDSVRGVISVSSGATLANYLDPYARGKLEIEKILREQASLRDFNLRILRAWSVSGGFVRHPDLYAFSSFVRQGLLTGTITVEANSLVYRRYCAVEELLAVGLDSLGIPAEIVIDSGGQRVEMVELAEMIASQMSRTSVEIMYPERYKSVGPSYESDNKSWNRNLAQSGLSPLDLDSQIENVVLSARASKAL